MNNLADDLNDAKQNRRGHGLKTAGAGTTAGIGVVIIGGCKAGLIGGPKGCAGAALIAAGGAVLGGLLTTIGSSIHLRQARERERALQRAYNNAKSAYCACIFGQEVDVLPEPELPPAPPEPDFDDLEDLEEQFEQCIEEEEEAPFCEMPDDADQYTPAPEEEDDVDLVCTGADHYYFGGM
jgi:hypothetical protein